MKTLLAFALAVALVGCGQADDPSPPPPAPAVDQAGAAAAAATTQMIAPADGAPAADATPATDTTPAPAPAPSSCAAADGCSACLVDVVGASGLTSVAQCANLIACVRAGGQGEYPWQSCANMHAASVSTAGLACAQALVKACP